MKNKYTLQKLKILLKATLFAAGHIDNSSCRKLKKKNKKFQQERNGSYAVFEVENISQFCEVLNFHKLFHY